MFADEVDAWEAEIIRHDGRGDYIDQEVCPRCQLNLTPRPRPQETTLPPLDLDTVRPVNPDTIQPVDPDTPAGDCSAKTSDRGRGVFKCIDCNGCQLFCGPCMVDFHACNPLHRLKVSVCSFYCSNQNTDRLGGYLGMERSLLSASHVKTAWLAGPTWSHQRNDVSSATTSAR
jgi:hypothetical protein